MEKLGSIFSVKILIVLRSRSVVFNHVKNNMIINWWSHYFSGTIALLSWYHTATGAIRLYSIATPHNWAHLCRIVIWRLHKSLINISFPAFLLKCFKADQSSVACTFSFQNCGFSQDFPVLPFSSFCFCSILQQVFWCIKVMSDRVERTRPPPQSRNY